MHITRQTLHGASRLKGFIIPFAINYPPLSTLFSQSGPDRDHVHLGAGCVKVYCFCICLNVLLTGIYGADRERDNVYTHTRSSTVTSFTRLAGNLFFFIRLFSWVSFNIYFFLLSLLSSEIGRRGIFCTREARGKTSRVGWDGW